MKKLGIALLVLSGLAFLVMFNMDTSVLTASGRSVHNVGLMSDRQNLAILAGVLALVGAIFLATSTVKAISNIAQKSIYPPGKANKSLQTFVGDLDISSPAYQLFLTKRFGIEKNTTLEKYVIGDDVFATLEESLLEANSRYERHLAKASEENERVLCDRLTSERKSRKEAAVTYKARAAYMVIIAVLVGFTLLLVITAKNEREAEQKEKAVKELRMSKYPGNDTNKSLCVFWEDDIAKGPGKDKKQYDFAKEFYEKDCKLVTK